MRKIVVTGGAGFIGSNFIDYVLKTYPDVEVTCIDNLSTGRKEHLEHAIGFAGFNFIEEDINNVLKPSFFHYGQIDAVFHFAALPRIQPSYIDIREHLDANVGGSVSIIESIIKSNSWNTKFIYSGSSAIYGNPKKFPTPETEPAKPLSPYGYQKLEVEMYLSLLSERYPKLQYSILRYFNPYGLRSYNPDNKFSAYSSVIGIFQYRKANGLPLLVTGDGTQSRDFVHVEELARANWAAFERGAKTAYNVGTGKTWRVIDVARMISDSIEFIPAREGEATITCANVNKIERELGIVLNKELVLA